MHLADRSAKILVFGLGRLGAFLVNELSSDFEVLGTKTQGPLSPSIKPFRLGGPLPELDKNMAFVIWCIPPRPQYRESLVLANDYFLTQTPFIFVSSTSVYRSEGIKTEDSDRDGKPNIIELEDTIKSFSRRTSIIRPSGLVDEQRHPKKFFKDNTSPEGGDSPVNLVHTEDVARFIAFLIRKDLVGEDFNLASDTHISKRDFYNELRDEPLQFRSIGSVQRIITSNKAKSFGFDFKHKDLLKYFTKK